METMKEQKIKHGGQKFTPLFSRLLFSFIIIMLIPLLLLSLYVVTGGNRALTDSLRKRAEAAIHRDADRVSSLFESYRHKGYLISTHPFITNAIEKDESLAASNESAAIYEALFDIMKGDVYTASALAVSASGNTRYATHLFPEQYDLRFHQHDRSPFFTLSRTSSETASLITIENRYTTERNVIAAVSILRRIRDGDGALMGYTVVDIFMDAFSEINGEFIFSDIILIEKGTYTAGSLMYDHFGSFARFPGLKVLEAPYDRHSYFKNGVIAAVYPITNTSLILAGIVETSPYMRSMGEFLYIIIGIGILGIAAATVLAWFLSKKIALPVDRLARTMQSMEQGIPDIEISGSTITEIAQLEHSFNRMVRQITGLLELTREEEAKIREAERKALESQMQPHFLYNTLNTVKSLAKLHGENDILNITTRLGKLLRSSIDTRQSEWPLRDSFDLIDDYLTIQKIRFGKKLHVEMDIDKNILDTVTPKLLIQPLVENAIIHGLEPKVGDWFLRISAKVRTGGRVEIRIEDNGIGFPAETLPEDPADLEASDHVGIYNVYRRFRLKYGTAAEFIIRSQPGEGTAVILCFPLREVP
jgi:two-component system sensor histidine kinase YesM